ncbi:cytochrome P450 [Umbelopsis sp. PMI_123]|nr:cytochrome P450 [Umbelopsis sp. PMI_123]
MSLMQQATEIWQSATERATKKSAAIAGATIVSIWVAVKLYRRRYNESAPPGYKARKDLVVPPGLPIIGNLHQMSISQLIERIENWAWEYGKAYKVYVGLAPLVILSSTTAIDQFFKERPLNIRRSSDTEKLFEDSNIAGLFSMEGERWRHSRNWMAPQLTQAKTNKAGHVISKHVVTLRAALQKVSKTMEEINEKFYPQITHLDESGHQTNVFYNPKELNTDITLFREYAFSVMLDFAFAHDNSSYMSPTLFKDLKVVFEVIRRRSLIPIRFYKYGIRDSLDRQYDKTISDLKTSIKRIIEDYNPEKYKQDEGRMSTMLESLYIASQEEDEDNADNRMRTATKAAKRVPIDDIVGNLITAIIAGYDTTANTLLSIAYLLSCNPEAQKKMQEEADAVFGPPENRVNMSAEEISILFNDDFIKQFPYANAVIQEANRLLPAASVLDGQLTKDLVIDDHYYRKGTVILVLTRVAAFRSCPTPDPFKFKPERWLECTPEQRRLHDKMAWGFGGGPRVCPGRHLATMELVTALVAVFTLFDIRQIERPFFAPKPQEINSIDSLLGNINLRYIPRY